MKRVAITGAGIISPIGNSLDSVRKSLLEGLSGVQAMPEWGACAGLRSRVAGKVENINPKEIPRTYRRTMGRMAVLASLAARDAVADATLEKTVLQSKRTGVVFGSTTGSASIFERLFGDYIAGGGIESMEGTLFMKVMSHTVAANVAAFLGTKGRLLAPCSACASSTQAIGAGFEMIQHGIQDVVICGGAEDLHPMSAGVFDILHAASTQYNDSPQKTPRPFDRHRDGLVVSEGAAAIVLEDYDRAQARGAAIRAEIRGYASYGDVSHMTSPSKDGMLRCMREALDMAGISPKDLDYINAHATGTKIGDPAEAEAIAELMGDAVPVSGTKGYTGHTLAASGAMEVIFCILMMEGGFLVPTLNLEEICPECEGICHLQQPVDSTPQLVMTSNFAFGGVNASLVLEKA
jgi:3-oxoacyl-[acyl-carrier-protein] synthase II